MDDDCVSPLSARGVERINRARAMIRQRYGSKQVGGADGSEDDPPCVSSPASNVRLRIKKAARMLHHDESFSNEFGVDVERASDQEPERN